MTIVSYGYGRKVAISGPGGTVVVAFGELTVADTSAALTLQDEALTLTLEPDDEVNLAQPETVAVQTDSTVINADLGPGVYLNG